MKVIGLCGGSGSGKGFIGKMFLSLDIPTIDTDKVYHELISKKSDCTLALIDEFGTDILNPDGSVSRPALRSLVFSHGTRERLNRLNEITHKFILNKTEELIKEYERLGKKAVIIDAPLLFESGFNQKCDIIILVTAEREVRIKRIMERDLITREAAERRIDSQLSDELLKERVDIVIDNSHDGDAALKKVVEISKRI